MMILKYKSAEEARHLISKVKKMKKEIEEVIDCLESKEYDEDDYDDYEDEPMYRGGYRRSNSTSRYRMSR